MMPEPSVAYIGLGANLGDAQATLRAAINALSELPGTRLAQQSSLYSSAPVDSSGDDYVNAVVLLQTSLAPQDLLAALQHIEQHFGRQRPYFNAPRTLDLDLLLYDQQRIHSASLQVPHPRMHQRAFVLRPLLEITPLITIPGLGSAQLFIAQLHDQVIHRLA